MRYSFEDEIRVNTRNQPIAHEPSPTSRTAGTSEVARRTAVYDLVRTLTTVARMVPQTGVTCHVTLIQRLEMRLLAVLKRLRISMAATCILRREVIDLRRERCSSTKKNRPIHKILRQELTVERAPVLNDPKAADFHILYKKRLCARSTSEST